MFMWLIPMGWLTLRSGSMPRVLGWILVVGGVAGVLGTFVSVLAPDASVLAGVLPLAVIPGEVWIIGYLLIKGMPGRAPGARTRSFRGCGGVSFQTHSDGDVLSHALVDALAGAIADGDLGTHFPEDDPEAQDARSLDFLPHMVRLVRAEGYEIANVDSFVVLGTLKLRPHLDGMRRNLAAALDIDVKQVSVKARSNDGLGEAGTGRACEAWATVLIYPAID
jgi:2-C-methyl-D-erythritol 2,4-cyclodiphosphate synthase